MREFPKLGIGLGQRHPTAIHDPSGEELGAFPLLRSARDFLQLSENGDVAGVTVVCIGTGTQKLSLDSEGVTTAYSLSLERGLKNNNLHLQGALNIVTDRGEEAANSAVHVLLDLCRVVFPDEKNPNNLPQGKCPIPAVEVSHGL